jgi:hypothetical protein
MPKQIIVHDISTKNQNTATTVIPAATTDESAEMTLFIETLVRATLGYSLLEIPEEKQDIAIQACVKLFVDFIENYVREKYGPKDALRLKASQQFAGQDIFRRFAELGDRFDEAYTAFFTSLQAS